MTTKEIKKSFADIRSDANRASNRKSLRFLQSRSSKLHSELSDSSIRPDFRKTASKEHSKTLKVISKRMKKVKD